MRCHKSTLNVELKVDGVYNIDIIDIVKKTLFCKNNQKNNYHALQLFLCNYLFCL